MNEKSRNNSDIEHTRHKTKMCVCVLKENSYLNVISERKYTRRVSHVEQELATLPVHLDCLRFELVLVGLVLIMVSNYTWS
jgi:chlorite dismutase